MSKLKNRHPQGDLFVIDLADVAPKDDMASMEHPLFSLATKPDQRHLEYGTEQFGMTIIPSGEGLPTVFDKDILIFCISKLIDARNRGEEIEKKIRFTAHEMLVATNRPTNGDSYKRLDKAFSRLMGTLYKTNIPNGEYIERRHFTLIESGSGFVFTADKKMRLEYCEIILSDWVMGSIKSGNVLTISRDYFLLRRPLERRLYEIARKHCGQKPQWRISLKKLQLKTGSNAQLKKFRMNLRDIIAADHTPTYRFKLCEKRDMVTVYPRKAPGRPDITLPEWAEEKVQEIAREKGRDYYALRDDWLSWAQSEADKGNSPENPGAAFMGYAKKLPKLR